MIGTKLADYEITSHLGTGGMGEVYQATDSKLGRSVAIKLLPEAFTHDTERVARFEREARVLASLNHPNIATIYGVEESRGRKFLVMELVSGETLAERIKRGPIPVEDSLAIATQITDALEAAHEKSVVHRDFKPANIKVSSDGKVKVLDFGLAKIGEVADTDASNSPTEVTASNQGLIMGTPVYMSPEQAKGREADRTSDVWAFGCVLYEMLTGRRAFEGETVGEILAGVLKGEPEWNRLPAETPENIRRLIRRCLQKEPRQRLRDIADARLEIESPPEAPPAVAVPTPWLWPGAATVFFVAAVLLGFLDFRPKPPVPLELTKFEIAQPPNVTYTDSFAISPDGRKLAFIAVVAGVPRLWVRSMESVEARPLAGTDGASGTPFWSPDSRFIVFYAQGKLQKIEGVGSPAQTLCSIPAAVEGGFWTSDNRIVFANRPFGDFSGNNGGVFEVSATGGAVSAVTKLAAGEYAHSYPTLLPDGRHFLYTRPQGGPTTGGIYLGSLDANPHQQGDKKLLPDVSKTAYASSDNSGAGPAEGYVLFVRGDALMAQPWDNRRLELVGEAVPIAQRVPSTGLSASTTGLLVYRTSAVVASAQLTWFDRQGKVLGTAGEPSVFERNSPPALSPDGQRVAFARTDQMENTDIWLFEFARGVSTRFTFDPGPDLNPVWSADGARVAFAGERNGTWGIYQKVSSNPTGSEELLYKSGNSPARPSSWSRDGRFLLFSAGSPYDIWMLLLNTGSAQGSADLHPKPLMHERFNERGARLSPDERYYAYVSNLSGQDEIYVQTFVDSSAPGARPAEGNWKISKDGGGAARWRGDGKEILYRAANGDLVSVDVFSTTAFHAGASRSLFRTPASFRQQLLFWDVTSDGQRFLFAVPGQNSAAPYTVVRNWQTLLKR